MSEDLTSLSSPLWIFADFVSSDCLLHPVNICFMFFKVVIVNVWASCSLHSELNKFTICLLKSYILQQLPEGRPGVNFSFFKRSNIKVRVQIDYSNSRVGVVIQQRWGIGVALIIGAPNWYQQCLFSFC